MSEEWRTCAECSDYQVSSLGRVRSIKFNRYKILKVCVNRTRKTFYCSICMSMGPGKIVRRYVHRLVAEAFLPQADNEAFEIDHIDSNPENNAVNNLRWVSRVENLRCIIERGRASVGEKHYASTLSKQSVQEIRQNRDNKTQYQLAKQYNVTQSHVSNIINRNKRKHD